ncbi:MAG: helicase associated domain-containing protein, partial [Magnetococcales bacterium]|nr:helicase associated domain-containing protein [Magnetococcales bacterium]
QRVELLNEIDFIWDAESAEWMEMMLAMQRFHNHYGHTYIPKRWKENPRLARWLQRVRSDHEKGVVPEVRVQLLTEIGVTLDQRSTLWEQMFAALVEFQVEHSHVNVPEEYPENSELAWWVGTQRRAHKNGNLDAERLARLNMLGFIWDPSRLIWQATYKRLCTFHQQYGHCAVPRKWSENMELALWVGAQRTNRKTGDLDEASIQALDAIGFIWDDTVAKSEELFFELTRFQERFGHCNVPAQWPESPQLGLWVQFQRQTYRRGALDPERTTRLDALGIDWEWLG